MKGKGEMLTFYVLGRKISRGLMSSRTICQGNGSLAEVVYGMVRARKKRTAPKGKSITRQKSSMILSARPTLLPVSKITYFT